MSRYTEMCKEVADLIMNAGFVVYLAKSGEYGFFTDEGENVIVSFSNFSYCARFSGCYIPTVHSSGCGGGWGICDVYPLDEARVVDVFKQAHYPPAWATNGNVVKLEPVAHHLKTYKASGFYKLERVEEGK